METKSTTGPHSPARHPAFPDLVQEPLRMPHCLNVKKPAGLDSSHELGGHELARPTKRQTSKSTPAKTSMIQNHFPSDPQPRAMSKATARSGGPTLSGASQTQPGLAIGGYNRQRHVQKSFPTEPFPAYPGIDSTEAGSSRSNPIAGNGDSGILLQPETRPITQKQLVNEVKGIYAGLVMVEKKCVEIDQQQAATTNKLTNEQWQALIALHRTLLHEHHDFFLASQHPSSSPALKRLATKYTMPACMWSHAIYSFLELLRDQLPDSLDHMLSFIDLAYSMMSLLLESVPSFEETWIGCLGDLARHRMAIEEVDMRDREVWAGDARMWYGKASDKSPNVGRIQHHLAVLARPNIVQQLFYYSKASLSVNPFPNARKSVTLLFNPFLANGEIASQRCPYARGSVSLPFNAFLERGDSIDRREQLMGRPGAVRCRVQELSQVKNGTQGQTPEDFTMRGLIWPFHYPAGFFHQSPASEDDDTSSQPAITRSQLNKSSAPSQNLTVDTEFGGLEQVDCHEQTTISRRSDKWTFTLRKVSKVLLPFAPMFIALSQIRTAIGQEDFYVPQTSTGSSWVAVLFLASAAILAGHLTKDNPSHALGLSVWVAWVTAVIWGEVDLATKITAVAVGLTPSLTIGLDYIWKRWRENDFHGRGQETHQNSRSDVRMMEEGDFDTEVDDDHDSFHWTDEPRQRAEPTEDRKDWIEKGSMIDQYQDRDSSPEPWNGTEGFRGSCK
jgi:Est1 DNA/RNA binding domain